MKKFFQYYEPFPKMYLINELTLIFFPKFPKLWNRNFRKLTEIHLTGGGGGSQRGMGTRWKITSEPRAVGRSSQSLINARTKTFCATCVYSCTPLVPSLYVCVCVCVCVSALRTKSQRPRAMDSGQVCIRADWQRFSSYDISLVTQGHKYRREGDVS